MAVSDFFENESAEIVKDQMELLTDLANDTLTGEKGLYDALEDLREIITGSTWTDDIGQSAIDYDYINIDDHPVEGSIDPTWRPTPPEGRPPFPSGSTMNFDDITVPDIDALNPIDHDIFPDVDSWDGGDAPTDEFIYNETIDDYQSTLADAVKTSLLAWINDGGTGLAEDVEEAIFDRARTRLTEAWELAFENADTFHSSRGFNIPIGPKNSLIRRVNADFERKEEDLNQKILEVQAELAQNNTQFAHTLSVTLEHNLQDHFNTVSTRLLEVAKTTVEMIYVIYEKKVQLYVAKTEAIATEIEAKEKIIDAQVAVNKGIIEKNEGETVRYKSEIDAVLGVIDGIARMYAAEVGGYGADIDLEKANINARVQRLASLIQQSTNQTELAIKEWEVVIQAYISSLGLNIEISKAIASILAQIAAGAMSGLNTHAGLSDATGRRYSKSESHTYAHGD